MNIIPNVLYIRLFEEINFTYIRSIIAFVREHKLQLSWVSPNYLCSLVIVLQIYLWSLGQRD